MNPAEDCLQHLMNKEWTKLNSVLSDNRNAELLVDSPTFSVFENVFIDELRRNDEEIDGILLILASRIFQIHNHKSLSFQLSQDAEIRLAKFLFDRDPQEVYAKFLVNDPEAKLFLEKRNKEIQNTIDTNLISSNINVKIGEHGKLKFDKYIFNSPQEKELFLAARKVLPNSILLPNTALSTIIDSKVITTLSNRTANFFYNSTLDLCIVNQQNFLPEYFIELDSSWHDKPRQIEKDKMKDEIFKSAGLKLERLRKLENREMIEIFELYISKKCAD